MMPRKTEHFFFNIKLVPLGPLVLIAALTLTVHAQKATHDDVTGITEVTSERLTVFQFHGFWVPPTKVYLKSFVIHNKGGEPIGGFKISVFNTTGWFPRPSDLLYVLADGQRYQFEVPLDPPKRSKRFDSVTTEIAYQVDANVLNTILNAKSVEMRVDNWSFSLKENQLKKLRKPFTMSSQK